MSTRLSAGLISLLILVAGTSTAEGQGPAQSATSSSRSLPQLLSTDQLAAWQKEGRTFTLIDVRSDVFTYLKGHLPGAEYLNTETLRASERGVPAQILSTSAYSSLFSRLGVSFDKPSVVYSAGETGNIDATFVAWLLAGFGHPKVFVLNGGYFKWELEHHPVVQEYPSIEATSFPAGPFSPERASLEDVRRAVTGDGAVLVDARPPAQYAGEAGAQIRRGHIPGAISHYWQDDLTQVGFGHVWKAPAELRSAYTAQGITPDKTIIAYCNSTTEASHVHFTLRYLLGYPHVRIYTGSWTEWAEKSDLPIEVGQQSRAAGGP
jgi:thiosulfate/3-mercaptopyruvate sulfurtransferase